MVGGRVFPGAHHRAKFTVHEADGQVAVALVSVDGNTRVSVKGSVTDQLPADSIFPSVASASAFFERGSLGYSASRSGGAHDGLELRTHGWQVAPLAVEHVASTFFEDRARFPSGSAEFDCALYMRDVAHEWHARGTLAADGATNAGVRPRAAQR